MKNSSQLEKEAIVVTAGCMAAAARTAPKTRGIDNIEIIAITGEETKKLLISKMMEISKKENRPSFERDANSIAECHSIIVLGVKSNAAGLNCGYCGYKTCDEMKKTTGVCAYNSIDLGIAASSAAAAANNFHIDNRIMFSIGKACLELKLLAADVNQALGIPLSVTGKSPYFDRK